MMIDSDPSEAGSAALHDSRREDRSTRRHIALTIATVVLIVGSALGLVGLHMRVYTVLSPFDEAAHLDYLIKVLDGHVVRRGEQMGQEAMRVASCRGAELEDLVLPRCGLNDYDPEEFPDRGFNYLHEHFPSFYVLTSVPVRLLAAVGINLVDAGRLSAGLWFGVGLTAFWVAGRRLRIPSVQMLIASTLLATTPNIVHASSTVNDDSTALLAGSGIVLGILSWERRGRGLTVLAFISALVVSLKPTHILAVLAGVLYLIGRAIASRGKAETPATSTRTNDRRSTPDYLRAAGALLAGAFLLMAIWLPVHEAMAVSDVDPQAERFRTESLGIWDVVGQVGSLLTPVLGPILGPFANVVGVGQLMGTLHLFIVAATFGAAFHTPIIGRPRLVALAGGLTLLIGGVGLTLVNFYLRNHLFVPLLPSRYAFSVLPMLFLGVAVALSRRSVQWIGGGFAALSLILTFNALLAEG